MMAILLKVNTDDNNIMKEQGDLSHMDVNKCHNYMGKKAKHGLSYQIENTTTQAQCLTKAWIY